MKKIQKLSIPEKAYLAGFVDGDGCINAQIVERKDYRLKFQIRVSITFFQSTTRHWFLLQLQKQIGYGTIRKRPDGNGMSELAIVGMQTVKNLLSEIAPYIRLKKQQVKLLEQVFEKLPTAKTIPDFLQVCEIVDSFEKWNYSKKRTITSTVVKQVLGKE